MKSKLRKVALYGIGGLVGLVLVMVVAAQIAAARYFAIGPKGTG